MNSSKYPRDASPRGIGLAGFAPLYGTTWTCRAASPDLGTHTLKCVPLPSLLGRAPSVKRTSSRTGLDIMCSEQFDQSNGQQNWHSLYTFTVLQKWPSV